MSNLPADHAAGLASLMARGNSPFVLESLLDKRQTSSNSSSMSAIIDSYIVNLKQAGFVPNANATTANTTNSKRDSLSLDSLIEKRSTPSIPLVINLLEQHGFVPINGTTSKRDIAGINSGLEKRTMPDINLVISRLEAHGFVPSGNRSQSAISKRDNASDINTVISQLEAYGFNPNDYMQANFSALPPANSTTYAQEVSPAPSSVNSSASVLSATTGVTCPQDDKLTFGTGNDTYQVLCGTAIIGYGLPGVSSDSLPECLEACSAYVPQGDLLSYGPCAGASWIASGNQCFLKYSASTIDSNSQIVSGQKIS